MSDSIVEIGAITFIVNIGKHEDISESEMIELGYALEKRFETAIEHRQLGDLLTVVSTSVGRGCVTIAITIGAVVVAVGTTTKLVCSFLKDYEDIRKGALLLAEDINGAKIKIERWAKKRPAWLFRDDLLSSEEAKAKLEEEAKKRTHKE